MAKGQIQPAICEVSFSSVLDVVRKELERSRQTQKTEKRVLSSIKMYMVSSKSSSNPSSALYF